MSTSLKLVAGVIERAKGHGFAVWVLLAGLALLVLPLALAEFQAFTGWEFTLPGSYLSMYSGALLVACGLGGLVARLVWWSAHH